MWNTVVNPLTDTITQVGASVALNRNPDCLKRTLGVLWWEIRSGNRKAQTESKILMKIHLVTITVKWSQSRGCTGTQLQCHSRSSNVSCYLPTRTRTSPGSAASTELNKRYIQTHTHTHTLARFSINRYFAFFNESKYRWPDSIFYYPVCCSGNPEGYALLVVQALQSFCLLFRLGGHGRGEHLLWGALY